MFRHFLCVLFWVLNEYKKIRKKKKRKRKFLHHFPTSTFSSSFSFCIVIMCDVDEPVMTKGILDPLIPPLLQTEL